MLTCQQPEWIEPCIGGCHHTHRLQSEWSKHPGPARSTAAWHKTSPNQALGKDTETDHGAPGGSDHCRPHGSMQPLAPGECPWPHPLHTAGWCSAWGRQIPSRDCHLRQPGLWLQGGPDTLTPVLSLSAPQPCNRSGVTGIEEGMYSQPASQQSHGRLRRSHVAPLRAQASRASALASFGAGTCSRATEPCQTQSSGLLLQQLRRQSCP